MRIKKPPPNTSKTMCLVVMHLKTYKDVDPELCDLALHLLRLPANSDSIKRIFSNFSLVQNKLRNRLGLEKTAKLVTCYRESRGSVEFDWVFALHLF